MKQTDRTHGHTITVALTGASGAMGKEAVARFMKQGAVKLRLLLHDTKRSRSYARGLLHTKGHTPEILFGDLKNPADCARFTRGADYLIHLAALIPPRADHDAKGAYESNFCGTKNLVDAIQKQGGHTRLIHISTVAIYGHRNEKHPFGRVGDPLLISAFDHYGASKLRAERCILDASLPHFVILRQTAVLYDNLLMNNIGDGLMFHTPWNTLIEWVSAHDSAVLLYNIIRDDVQKKQTGFWNRVYNIGGGISCRQTGYETYDSGFSLIGATVRDCFDPRWTPVRNFHCFWFSDSEELEERFHFRSLSCDDFWKQFAKRHRLYAAARLLPKRLIKKLILEPLTRTPNAPSYWVTHKDRARVHAFYGGEEAFHSLPRSWRDVSLICARKDYASMKKHDASLDLSHGYDESKPEETLELTDMQEAAAFRGGSCLSAHMKPGDLYGRLRWKCHAGHVFEASPYTVLKAGHWCMDCQPENIWQYDFLARHVPFYAQVWYDSHDPDEAVIYSFRDGKARMEHLT